MYHLKVTRQDKETCRAQKVCTTNSSNGRMSGQVLRDIDFALPVLVGERLDVVISKGEETLFRFDYTVDPGDSYFVNNKMSFSCMFEKIGGHLAMVFPQFTIFST